MNENQMKSLGERTTVLEEKYHAAEKALVLAAEALKDKLEAMNGIRAELGRVQGSFITRDRLDAVLLELSLKGEAALKEMHMLHKQCCESLESLKLKRAVVDGKLLGIIFAITIVTQFIIHILLKKC